MRGVQRLAGVEETPRRQDAGDHANSDVIYAMSYVDLGKDGPLVSEGPPMLWTPSGMSPATWAESSKVRRPAIYPLKSRLNSISPSI